MTVRGSADVAFFLVDGYDVLGTVTQLTDKVTAKNEETHALGDAWTETLYTGVREGEITQDGFYDDAALSAHAALSSGPGNSSRVLCIGMDGTATGAFFRGLTGIQVDYAVEPARAVLHKAKATYKNNGRVDKGRILQTLKASAGTSAEIGNAVQREILDANGSATNTTIATSGGGAGYIQMTAFTSGVNATAIQSRIQHSTDGVAWVDLISFASATAAPFAQRSELGSTVVVNAFLRCNTSFQGSGSAQMTAFWGFARY